MIRWVPSAALVWKHQIVAGVTVIPLLRSKLTHLVQVPSSLVPRGPRDFQGNRSVGPQAERISNIFRRAHDTVRLAVVLMRPM
mmetsp:Transcript_39735/g.62426  ORF Transcript_39735/g.62426 Transcript_39735/m.62426 type:complete len:83 (+) Transcript_39735:73-321(+)